MVVFLFSPGRLLAEPLATEILIGAIPGVNKSVPNHRCFIVGNERSKDLPLTLKVKGAISYFQKGEILARPLRIKPIELKKGRLVFFLDWPAVINGGITSIDLSFFASDRKQKSPGLIWRLTTRAGQAVVLVPKNESLGEEKALKAQKAVAIGVEPSGYTTFSAKGVRAREVHWWHLAVAHGQLPSLEEIERMTLNLFDLVPIKLPEEAIVDLAIIPEPVAIVLKDSLGLVLPKALVDQLVGALVFESQRSSWYLERKDELIVLTFHQGDRVLAARGFDKFGLVMIQKSRIINTDDQPGAPISDSKRIAAH